MAPINNWSILTMTAGGLRNRFTTMTRLSDTIRPAAWTPFRRLWCAATISRLGDGVVLLTLPLLAKALTDSPAAVAGVAIAEALPWLVLGLLGGALVDRLDRRRVMLAADGFRAVLMVVMAVAVVGGWITLPLIYGGAFLLGTGEAFFDSAAQAILPDLVDDDHLEQANAQLSSSEIVMFQLAGPPLGALLFLGAAFLPLAVNAASFAVAVGLVATVSGSFRARTPAAQSNAHTPARALLREVGDGLRWLGGNRVLRTIAAMQGAMNLFFTAALSVFAIFALDVLGAGEFGYGLIFSVGAIGGLLGCATATTLSRLIGSGTAMVGAILVTGAAFVTIALARSAMATACLFAVVFYSAGVWTVLTSALRQRIVPASLAGRVTSAFRTISMGTIPVGGAIGGLLGTVFGTGSPFLFGGIAMIALGIPARRVINNRSIDAARGSAMPRVGGALAYGPVRAIEQG